MGGRSHVAARDWGSIKRLKLALYGAPVNVPYTDTGGGRTP
jgi:hypothetical protein